MPKAVHIFSKLGVSRTPIRSNFWIFDAGLACVFVALVVTGFPITWMTNDSAVIAESLSLGYPALFVNSLLPSLVEFWPLHPPHGPGFFASFLIFAHVISLGMWFAAMRHAWLSLGSTRKGVTLCAAGIVGAYLALYASCLIRLEFSSTALLLGVNSCLYGISVAFESKLRRSALAAAALGLAYACMIRSDAALQGIAMITLPLLVLALGRLAQRKTIRPRKGLLILLLIGLPAVLLTIVDGIAKKSSDSEIFHDYLAYNEARWPLHLSRETQPPSHTELARAGWTEQEWNQFSQWTYFAEDQFPQAKLNTLSELIWTSRFGLGRLVRFPQLKELWPAFQLTFGLGKLYLPTYMAALLLGGILLFRRSAARCILWPWAALACLTAYPFSLSFLLALTMKLPERVALPVLLAGLATLMLGIAFVAEMTRNSARQAEDIRQSRSSVTGLSLSLSLCALLVSMDYLLATAQNADQRLQKDAIVKRDLAALANTVPLLVQPGSGFALPVSPTQASLVRYVPIGWLTYSPWFYDVLARDFGVSRGSDLLSAYVDRPGTYVVGTRSWAELLVRLSPDQIKLRDAGPIGPDRTHRAFRLESSNQQ